MTEEWKKMARMSICPVCGRRCRELESISNGADLKVCYECIEDFRASVRNLFDLYKPKFFGKKDDGLACPFCLNDTHEWYSLRPLFEQSVCINCANDVNDMVNMRIEVRRAMWKEWKDESND